MNKQKQKIAQRYRNVSWGRLYWNSKNTRYRRLFDAGDVAVVKDGPITIHYTTTKALINEIESMEREQFYGVKKQRG